MAAAASMLVTGGIPCGYVGRWTSVLVAKRRKTWVVHSVPFWADRSRVGSLSS